MIEAIQIELIDGCNHKVKDEVRTFIAMNGLGTPIPVKAKKNGRYTILAAHANLAAVRSLVASGGLVWDKDANEMRPATEVYSKIQAEVR